ncbi:hypothetical protein D3C87_997620 [compost metagenome]
MKTLLILVPLFLSSLAFAGAPSEDAAVANLRNRFTKADLPSKSDLKLDKEWVCSWNSALAGSVDSGTNNTWRFVESGGVIVYEKSTPFIELGSQYKPQTFAFTKTGLVGSAPTKYANITSRLVFRISKGDLIGEWNYQGATADVNARMAQAGYTSKGISYPSAQVSHYMLCPKKEVRKAYRGGWYVPRVR